MNDRELIDLITRKVLEQVESLPCEGCATRICEEVKACHITAQQNQIPVGISARHAHLTKEHLEQLYGSGHELTVRAELYQPGNFAAEETVTVVGPRMRSIEAVRILGPLRNYSQVEISRTDGITLGLDPPVRDSGDLEGAAPILLVGPAGSVFLEEGAICAARHVHMTSDDAECLDINPDDDLKVRIPGVRALTFENVRPKIGEGVFPQLHLDTDDANAAGIRGGEAVQIIKD
jgi:putative phosphotransacetylase